MTKIEFYNYYHNGDLFCSKSFIKQIVSELKDYEFAYFHNNNPKTISDLAPYGGRAYQDPTKRFIYEENKMSINTWIGIYIPEKHPEPPHFWNEGINYIALYNIWNYTYSKINDYFGTNLKIKSSPKDYLSTIDYSKFNVDEVDRFLSTRIGRKKILFSNGLPMSGQSFGDNLSSIIIFLSERYSNYDFYCTDKFEHNRDNIFFTSDITKQQSDLNEISWLSRSCDLIVGKNSGPFIYCLEKDNFTNPNKTFISFNNSEIDSLNWGIDIESDYTCSKSMNLNEIFNVIDGKIKWL